MSDRPTLRDLFLKYGHTDKHTSHRYDFWYEQWLAPYRDRAITIVELGVAMFGGGDVLAFSDYFPSGKVVGIDANMTPLISNQEMSAEFSSRKNITLVECDAYGEEAVKWTKDATIVIDDCIHSPAKQLEAFRLHGSHPKLYFCEDTYYEPWHSLPRFSPNQHITIIDMSRNEKQAENSVIVKIERIES
jgi:hypothetical protein